ncbi:hypothetical protein FRZ61_37390 [Hypericibacter adhaerens]|jgi:hypothetical protein|uniref:Succinoglycan biosynthesis protein exoi n=1 Tax=Hypericibacter adhaerens TaxID=2602016 RepID=A0A5J6N5H0_9PROT|nr:hypothetical protein [Hypericibacter adhaerens]QEX23800.1 hypothetical protein FRZ61_37390 [Hypericibacter adhaerens]
MRRHTGKPRYFGASKPRRESRPWVHLAFAVAIGSVLGFTVPEWSPLLRDTADAAGFSSQCNIKGNISFSGERIYHVPGGEFYDVTRISLFKGERWFCTEAEAQAAGWRRSLQ